MRACRSLQVLSSNFANSISWGDNASWLSSRPCLHIFTILGQQWKCLHTEQRQICVTEFDVDVAGWADVTGSTLPLPFWCLPRSDSTQVLAGINKLQQHTQLEIPGCVPTLLGIDLGCLDNFRNAYFNGCSSLLRMWGSIGMSYSHSIETFVSSLHSLYQFWQGLLMCRWGMEESMPLLDRFVKQRLQSYSITLTVGQ